MTSTIHHPVAIPSRGLTICEMEDESSEPKTILEIGGVSRPKPTYILPPSHPRIQTLANPINNQTYLTNWKAQHDIVGPSYPFTDFQEQRIVRISNVNWTGHTDKLTPMSPSAFTSKGMPYFHDHSCNLINFKYENFSTVCSMTCLISIKYTSKFFLVYLELYKQIFFS